MATKRKGISPKIRFEVFKRDSFTCQYCGGKSPIVTLRVDHINPVKNGGDNNIINLITSCFECNSGKGAILMDDQKTFEVQHNQLKQLNERRKQIEMMAKWRDELSLFEDNSIDIYVKKINSKIGPTFSVNDNFKIKLRKMVKESTPSSIFEAIDESYRRNIEFDSDGLVTSDSTDIFLDKIKGIAYFKSLPPKDQKIKWLSLCTKKRFPYEDTSKITFVLNVYWDAMVSTGSSESEALEDLQTQIRNLIYHNKLYYRLLENIESWINKLLCVAQ